MSRPPNENPEEMKALKGMPSSTGVVVSEEKLKRAISEAITKIDTKNLRQAQEAIEIEEQNLNSTKNSKEELELHDLRQNTELRRVFAHRSFVLVVAWMAVVTVLVILSATEWPSSVSMYGGPPINIPTFKLSDAVLIALLTTTTVNIIGLLLAVTLNLFPSSKH